MFRAISQSEFLSRTWSSLNVECVIVCVQERERNGERKKENRERELFLPEQQCLWLHPPHLLLHQQLSAERLQVEQTLQCGVQVAGLPQDGQPAGRRK